MAAKSIRTPSLKHTCMAGLQAMILSGQYKIGQKLPPERELAATLGVSRPVVHQALVELASQGLVRIAPRKGVTVNDFRVAGSSAILTQLLSYGEGELEPAFLGSMLAVRRLIETDVARLAAANCSAEQLAQLGEIVDQELENDRSDLGELAELDFAFHQLIALSSGNMVYPLILNSFKAAHTNITRKLFARHPGQPVLDQVFDYHRRILVAIAAHDSEAAATIMDEMLHHATINL